MTAPRELVIVQDCETQFDAPLYAYLVGQGGMALRIYYTQTHSRSSGAVDPEIGQAPRWDHLIGVEYPHSHRPTRRLSEVFALAREIEALYPAHVILSGYSPPAHLMVALLLRRAGLSIGLRSDNTLKHSGFDGLKGWIKRLILPPILRLYATWHPVGSAAEAYLRSMAGAERPVYRFPYAADNDWFALESAPWRARRGAWRKAQGWGEDDLVVLGVLKWHPREDPLTLVRAFIALRGAVPTARLVLVGDGPLRGEIQTALAGHREAVHLPGYVPYRDLPRWYALADVFVHPAASEPWGVSVNEAMACGLPVAISAGVGAGIDLVAEGETGMVFPVGDASALAQRLAALARDRGRCTAMGHAAQTRIARWGYTQTRQAMVDALARSVALARPKG